MGGRKIGIDHRGETMIAICMNELPTGKMILDNTIDVHDDEP
jgi:hypothetical protein